MSAMPFTYDYDATPGVLESLSVLDISISLLILLFIFVFLLNYRNKRRELEYNYFFPFFFFKIACTLGFVILYVYKYGGGDSVGFWSGSNSLLELAHRDFGAFIQALFGDRNSPDYFNSFVANNVSFPGWILREDEGSFTSKVGLLFNFLTGMNFLATSFIFMFFSFLTQWQFYIFIKRNFVRKSSSKIVWMLLFIPSVSFWCSGFSKDTIVLICVLGFIMNAIEFLFFKNYKLKHILWTLFFMFVLYKVRNVILAIVLVSFLIAYIIGRLNEMRYPVVRAYLKLFTVFAGFGLMIGAIIYTGAGDVLNGYLQEAEVVQQDFSTNTSYTGSGYSIGVQDFTVSSMIASAPISILSGMFRPFIWEAFSPTLILNGLEGLVLSYLFFVNVVLQFRQSINEISRQKILMLSAIIVLLYAFSTGFTSVIFGVLVRLRAPLLIFLGILIYWKDLKKNMI